MHPYISQALAAERVNDRHRKAANAQLIRQARASRPSPQTITVAPQPEPVRLMVMPSGRTGRKSADTPADRPVRAA